MPKLIILPQVKDEEENDWRMKVYDSNNNKLPAFVELLPNVLIIAPSYRNIGKHSISIDLIDEFDARSNY